MKNTMNLKAVLRALVLSSTFAALLPMSAVHADARMDSMARMQKTLCDAVQGVANPVPDALAKIYEDSCQKPLAPEFNIRVWAFYEVSQPVEVSFSLVARDLSPVEKARLDRLYNMAWTAANGGFEADLERYK